MAGGRRDGGYIVDRLLLPRIEQYGHNNSINNVDAVVDYLRACYPEYQRKQLGPFRKVVFSAVRIAKQRMRDVEHDGPGGNSPEHRLESRRGRRASQAQSVDVSEVDTDSEGAVQKKERDDSSDEFEVDKAKPSFNLLNSSLMSTYNARPALVIQSPTFNGTSVFGNLQIDSQKAAEKAQDVKPELSSPDPLARIRPKSIASKDVEELDDKKVGKDGRRKRERDSEQKKTQFVKKSKSLPEKKENVVKPRTDLGFKDFGGLGAVQDEIVDFILPVMHPSLFQAVGTETMRGLLLHGPPGCGKTMLAEAIANEANVPLLKISAPEIVSGTSGESEAKLRSLFADATRIAPSLIFIDEIDSISSKRDSAQREMERRIVTQLMLCMDELSQASTLEFDNDGRPPYVLLIGATNRPDSLDQALRRRFEREVCLGVPDEDARAHILMVLTRKMKLEGDFDFKGLARRTPGYVGADLKTLTKEAGLAAVKRTFRCRSVDTEESGTSWWKVPCTPEHIEQISVTMQDFDAGMKKVQPSTKREGFTEIPNITFEDVGSLDSVRDMLELFICRRISDPEDYEALRFTDCGFLLYGPPGCGKTLIAKAAANSAGVNFIYIKAGELFNKYVGESERAVRQLFARARACAPCVIFFDEVDALAPNRGNEANAATDRVVNQLLVEMDGLEQRKGIFLLAATNRPNMIDPALLRPGRLGKRIYVPMPDAQGRTSILKALLRRMPLTPDVDVPKIAEHDLCKDFTGADLQGLVQEACSVALRERFSLPRDSPREAIALTQSHFLEALERVKPSVSIKDYDKDFNHMEKRKPYRAVACAQKA